MTESIQAYVAVSPADIPLLDAALAKARDLAGSSRFVVTPQEAGRVALQLEAADHAALVAAIEAIGPAFSPLDGRVQVDGLAFSPGVSASVQTRVSRAAA